MRALKLSPLGPLTFRKPAYFGIGSVADSYRLPTISMLNGALRTAIGNEIGVNWREYATNKGKDEWYRILGKPSAEPPFTVSHPFLIIDGKWFFKAPFNVIVAEKSGSHEAIFLPFETDVEHIPVKLPKLIAFDGRQRKEKEVFISAEMLSKLMDPAGQWTPVERGRDFVFAEDVTTVIWHTGIKVSRESGTVDKGDSGKKGFMFRLMLVEFQEGVEIGVVVNGLDGVVDNLNGSDIILGAKGGMVRVSVSDEIPVDINKSGSKLWILYSGTPADDPPWKPLFSKKPDGAALQGKHIHTGFDMAKRDGKPTVIYLPPASTFYFDRGCTGPISGIFITM